MNADSEPMSIVEMYINVILSIGKNVSMFMHIMQTVLSSVYMYIRFTTTCRVIDVGIGGNGEVGGCVR